MNSLTQKILIKILASDSSWDFGTRKEPIIPPKLRYGYVTNELQAGRSILYMAQVFWPAYFKMVNKMMAICSEDCFEWDEDNQQWMIADPDLQILASEKFENYIDWFLLEHPEWEFEEPTLAEILTIAAPPQKTQQLEFGI